MLFFLDTDECSASPSVCDINANDHSCIMGNQGKRAGNSKICIGIQSQLILPEFIYLVLSP